MAWFETITGFPEESPQQVRENITVDGQTLKSHANGKILVREVVANVQHLHINVSNAGSLFQVASQFNLLEMVSPNYTPEDGVSIYENDRTQGPACAIAAGAGTVSYTHLTLPTSDLV